MKKLFSVMLVLLLLLSLVACGGSSTENAPENKPTQSEAPDPEPETEPEPEPEPYIPPDPVVYSGSGDDVVSVEPLGFSYAIFIEGNQDGNHFAVKNYNADGEQIDLLVNTTDPYSGMVLDSTLTTALLEIKATGDWMVEFVPLELLPEVSCGITANADNDEVFLCDGSPKIAKITGNAAEKHFAIWAYGANETDLIVNTTDPYEGTVMLPKETLIFVVKAVGDWSITLE